MACAHLDPRYLSLPLNATGAPQAVFPALKPRRSESEWVSPCVGSWRGTAWGSRSFFHWLNPHWVLQPEVTGTYLPGTGTLGWGSWCGAGTRHSWEMPPKFLSTSCGCGTSLFGICPPPTSLDGCGFFNSVIFFNSVVVRFLFNLISVVSEQWLFYILVIIFLLCKEVSHVCLYRHLDWKSPQDTFKSEEREILIFIQTIQA